MKWAFLLVGNILVAMALFVPSGSVSAQTTAADACRDALQAQTKDQAQIDADVECAADQQLPPTDQADPDVKGQPNPETVAGREQSAQNQGVLGASTAVLAATDTNELTATGSSPLLAIGVGLLLLSSVIVAAAAVRRDS